MLFGYPRDHVSNEFKVSSGSVSKYWDDFKADAVKMGYERVGREYDLTNELEGFRRLGSELIKNNLTMTQAITGIRVQNTLKSFSVDETKLEQFLREVYTKSNEVGCTSEIMLEYSKRMLLLEKETGLNYQSILTMFEEKEKQIKEQEKKIEKLKQETTEAEKRSEDALTNLDMTKETLSEYQNVRENLAKYRIEVREIPRLVTMIRNAKELNYNIERIVNYISQIEDLAKHFNQLKETLDKMNGEEKGLKEEVNDLRRQREIQDKYINDLIPRSIEAIKTEERNVVESLKEYDEKIEGMIKSLDEKRTETSKTIDITLDESTKYIKSLKDEAIKFGEEIGRLEAIGPILTLLDRGEGDRYKSYLALSFFCKQFQRWIRKNNILDPILSSYLDTIIMYLEHEFTRS